MLTQYVTLVINDSIVLDGGKLTFDTATVVIYAGADSSALYQLDSLNGILTGNIAALGALQTSYQQNLSNSATGIATGNSAINDTSMYEDYRQQVNAIYMRSLGSGVDTFSSSDSATLFAIGGLCPYVAGSAVYQAQALYNLITPYTFITFDCSSNEDRMMKVPNTDTIAKSMQVKLYPNPASDKLMLDWRSDSMQTAILTIEDMLGQTLLTINAASNTGPQAVDISKLSDGTYTVWLKQAKHPIYQNKVVIMK